MGVINVGAKKIRTDAKLPSYISPNDAGMAVYAATEVIIPKNTSALIPTGFKIAVPFGTEIQVRPKNTTNPLDLDLTIDSMPGTINYNDNDEEFAIVATNNTNHEITITKGSIVAQIILMAIPRIKFIL
jgi:dUTP pyrophosphatase